MATGADDFPRDCAVVLNAGAGTLLGTDGAHEGLEETFHRHGLRPRIQICRRGSDIDGFVGQALEQGVGLVIAGGGDGTVSTVAAHLVGSDACLGVLPLGTLNHFAKDLGLPLDRDEAIAVIGAGHATAIDAAMVNDTVFINNSSLGLYPLAVRLREEEQRRGTGKWLAFTKAAMAVLGRYPLLTVRMSVDGEQIVRRTPIVFIGNNHYELEGLEMSRRQRLDEGVLSICVTREVTRLGLLGLLGRALLGRLRNAEDFSVLEGAEVTIEAPLTQLRVANDGEVALMRTPLRYRACRGALNVIVPAPGAANQTAK